MVEREFPGIAERLRIGPRAQAIGGRTRHADRAARLFDAARGGERLDEGDLLVGRPAIMPAADRDGIEGGHSCGFVGATLRMRGRDGFAAVGHSPL
jgi:hypothetical protein